MKVKEAIEIIERDGWTLSRMRTAIKFHLEGLKKEGCDIREPSTKVKYLEISV